MFEMIKLYVETHSVTLILIFAMLLCAYVVYIMEKMARPPCRIIEGSNHAKTLFENFSVDNAYEQLNEYVGNSRAFGNYDDFDKGIDEVINQTLNTHIDKINDDFGGDWYFCRTDLKFKDSLTDRVKVL